MRSAHPLCACLLLGLLPAFACANAGSDDDDDVAGPDAALGAPDAADVPDPPDAAPGAPDAMPGAPDAMPGAPDAAPGTDGGVIAACDEAALLPDNDTCADAIDLTAGAEAAGGVTTYGDTRLYTNVAEPPSACTGGFGQDGPDAIYAIDAADGDTISVTMTPVGYDGSIYILSDCADPTSCELGADSEFAGETETLSYPVTADATYYLFVDAFLSTESGCYTLHVELL